MTNLARKLDNDPVFEDIGRITRLENGAFEVTMSSGDVDAVRAASCLLEPALGDRVLVGGCRREGWYILAILTRHVDTKHTLGVDGDLEVRLRSGRFAVAAQEGVQLVSPGHVSIAAGTVNVNAVDGNVVLTRLTFLSTYLRAEVEKIKLFAERFDSTIERVAQKVKRSYRSIEETDQVRAERIDYVAKKTMSLHGENALLTAKELVKVDGEQIHMG